MPVAQARDGLSREAPRFAPITTLQGIPVLLGIPGTNPWRPLLPLDSATNLTTQGATGEKRNNLPIYPQVPSHIFWTSWRAGSANFFSSLIELELELELIQTQMTQTPMLWAEVGTRVHCANKASAEWFRRGRGMGQIPRKICKKRGICGWCALRRTIKRKAREQYREI